MLKIFTCLEGMRSRCKLRPINFFLLLSVLSVWFIGVSGVVSAQVVEIPDPNLRAAIAAALDKAPDDAITRAEMETLDSLSAKYGDITDLRGIEFAINLTSLVLGDNNISDISPVSTLTNLKRLGLGYNTISDISPVSNLTNLKTLGLRSNRISDISPVSTLTNLTKLVLESNRISDISSVSTLTNLTLLYLHNNTISDISSVSTLINLTRLDLYNNTISDISPVSTLTNLTSLHLESNRISDISPVSTLTNLTYLNLGSNRISDISPVSTLTNLTYLILGSNTISDISPVSTLTNLTILHLHNNTISDISPVSTLTNLAYLYLHNNTISDIFPLISLTNLEFLVISNNPISDRATLAQLIAQGTVVYFTNTPAFETPGMEITEGWVWGVVPAVDVWSGWDAVRSGRDFLSEASGGAVTEADVAVNGATAGTRVGDTVWTFANLEPGDNNNLGALVETHGLGTGDELPVAYGVISVESETQQDTWLYIGDSPVKVYLNGTVVYLGDQGWYGGNYYRTAVPVTLNTGTNQLLIAAYKPYRWSSRWSAFFGFQEGTDYKVVLPGNMRLDVNGDGIVNVLDLILVAVFYGTRGNGLPADVNADGIVNVDDFAAVAAGVDAAGALPLQAVEAALLAAAAQAGDIEAIAGAPVRFGNPHQYTWSRRIAYRNVAAALADIRHLAASDARLGKGAALLAKLLQLLKEMNAIPETTALLPNYPNPFNPETWIPYHLATGADVTVTIYNVQGDVVRTLMLGHQPAGVYESRGRAAYWDGRNALGEPVASGLYFYTLTAGDFTATRKLLIAK